MIALGRQTPTGDTWSKPVAKRFQDAEAPAPSIDLTQRKPLLAVRLCLIDLGNPAKAAPQLHCRFQHRARCRFHPPHYEDLSPGAPTAGNRHLAVSVYMNCENR
jgi:hypothetical protein